MKNNTIIYIVIIIVLTIILGVFWYLIINNNSSSKSNSNSNSSSNNSNMHNNSKSNSSITYSSSKEINKDEEISEGSFSSSKADENAILVTGNIKSTLSNISVDKTGDSDGGDNTSFYGTNSAIIAKDGANVTIENAEIETDATGANGVFSYGGSATTNNTSSDNTTINISNSTTSSHYSTRITF